MNTHTHPDHIGINRDLQKTHQLSTCGLWGGQATQMRSPASQSEFARVLGSSIGDASGVVWLTEGHIDGHVSFLADGCCSVVTQCLVADVDVCLMGPLRKCTPAFSEWPSSGRRDGGLLRTRVHPRQPAVCMDVRAETTLHSTENPGVWAIRRMGGSTVPSTIAEERETNPFMRVAEASIRWAVTQHFPEVDARDGAQVLAALRAWKNRGDHRAMPDDVLPV